MIDTNAKSADCSLCSTRRRNTYDNGFVCDAPTSRNPVIASTILSNHFAFVISLCSFGPPVRSYQLQRRLLINYLSTLSPETPTIHNVIDLPREQAEIPNGAISRTTKKRYTLGCTALKNWLE